MPGLEANLEFSRPRFRLRLDLSVPPTGVTALIGPSGCGKSTLLRLLAGLETPGAGHIQHGDRVWFDHVERIDLAPRHRRVGFLFQDYALFPHLCVADNIAYGLPRDVDRKTAVALWLTRLELESLATRYPQTLSGGQRQRVALARALASEPDVLLLDEPFSAVDFSLRQSLRQLFQEVVAERQVSTILVTHDLDDVRYLADRVGVLIEGTLRQLGSTSEVFARPLDAQVARVLGWHNLLPVTSWSNGSASGDWGGLEVDAGILPARPWVLAIHPDGPRLNTGDGLPVLVQRVIDMGAYWALLCRLADHTPLRIHLGAGNAPPAPGIRTRLSIPPECIRPLPSGHSPVSLTESVVN